MLKSRPVPAATRNWLAHIFAAAIVAAVIHVPRESAAQSPFDWSSPHGFFRGEEDTIPGTNPALDRDVCIATDGRGTWIAAWNVYSRYAFGEIFWDHNYNVVFIRSTDDGATWSAPAYLNSDAPDDDASMNDGSINLAVDGNGNWIAVWSRTESAVASPDAIEVRDIRIARSNDGGVTWSDPEILVDTFAQDPIASGLSQPRIGTDRAGSWIVSWLATYPLFPGTRTDLFVMRSTDNGVQWTAPEVKSSVSTALNIGAFATGLELSTDNAGTWIANWNVVDTVTYVEFRDSDLVFSRSEDNGVTWSVATALNSTHTTDSWEDVGAALATDASGNWVAIWTAYGLSGPHLAADPPFLLFARSTDGGIHWSEPALFDSGPLTGFFSHANPELVFADELWLCVWSAATVYVPGSSMDGDLVFSTSSDDGETWSPLQYLNDDADTDSAEQLEDDFSARIATDGFGTWLTFWERRGHVAGLGGGTIFFSKSIAQWVDFGNAGAEDGSQLSPFGALAEAVGMVQPYGRINIRSGPSGQYTPETLTISKPVTIRAVGGPAAIGGRP